MMSIEVRMILMDFKRIACQVWHGCSALTCMTLGRLQQHPDMPEMYISPQVSYWILYKDEVGSLYKL